MVPSVAELPVDSHPTSNRISNGNSEELFTYGLNEDDVTIREEMYGSKKKMRVAMLGAGVSGLNFFKFAEDRLENVDIICYEKNRDIGGVWLSLLNTSDLTFS